MRTFLLSCSLLLLVAAAFGLGRELAERATAAERPGPAPTVAGPVGAPLAELLGSAVHARPEPGAAGPGAALGQLADLVVDTVTGRTRGCIVAFDGPDGPAARRLDLRAEAWEPGARRVRLGLGARAFSSLPEFDRRALEPGAVLASELLAVRSQRRAELRVDLDRQRLSLVTADARTLAWQPPR